VSILRGGVWGGLGGRVCGRLSGQSLWRERLARPASARKIQDGGTAGQRSGTILRHSLNPARRDGASGRASRRRRPDLLWPREPGVGGIP